MRRLNMKRHNWIPGCLAAMVALLVACSTDTPTAPVQVPSTPTPAINAFILSITVSPESLEVGSPTPATVTVKATHRDTGENVANGTSIVVSTTLGDFQAVNSEIQAVAAVVDRGKANVFFYAGEVIGTASLRAELSGSVGRADVAIRGLPVDPVDPFITAMSPTNGPEGGGTTVTIEGVGFREPLRVTFGDVLGTVLSVTDKQIRVKSPPGDIQGASCDTNGDGTLDGFVKNDKTVPVTVEIGDGATSDSFDFTYLVANAGMCV